MWADLWRMLKAVVIAIGVFLAFVSLVECIQAYQILRGVHPVLGWLFLAVLLVALGWGVAYYIVAMLRRPAVLTPPPRRDLATASAGERRLYARYLVNVMERLAGNGLVPEDQKKGLRAEATALKGHLGGGSDGTQLVAALDHAVDQVILPAVVPLDEEAARRVRNCVRDTMLGVTVSPWRSVDLFVVLYRNGRMVLEVSSIYNGRPRLREQTRILSDVLKVAATVQFLNIGSKLMENLTSWIPVLGRFTDDIAQGIGAGLFTSVTGYATIDRCRAFRGWSEEEARSGMGGKLKQFMQDLKGIVTDTVVPALGRRIEAEIPAEGRVPNFMERVKSGIGEAIDATSDVLDGCVRKPVTMGVKGVTTTGAILWDGTRRAGTGVGRAIGWTGRQGWNLSALGVKTVGKGTVGIVKGVGRAAKGTAGLVRGHKKDGESD